MPERNRSQAFVNRPFPTVQGMNVPDYSAVQVTNITKIPESPPWWGYSINHGWVVIDRSIPPNKSGLSQDILYFRCRDSMIFLDSRSRWRAPLYIYASTYIASLEPSESEQAAQEYERLKSRWPEFQAEIRNQCELSEARQQEREQERIQSEEQLKKAGKGKRKIRKADPVRESEG